MKKGQLSITFVCFILGIMLVTQMKSVKNLGGLITSQRADQLLVNIIRIKDENNLLEQNMSQLQEDIGIFESKASNNNALVETILTDVTTAKKQSGYSNITGPGISITLDYEGDENLNPFHMYPQLMLSLINELNSAGANAISINDERIVYNTEIISSSDHYKINGKKCTQPYTLKAIGDPQKMKSAINIHYGIVHQMKDNLITVNTNEYNSMTITAHKSALDIHYAKPIK